jgi:gluconolactonase
MNPSPTLIVEGLALPEGPVWCDDGTLVVTAVAEGALYRIWPEERRKEKIADTAGGANSAALASDGGFVVTQNGGVDFGNRPLPNGLFKTAPYPPVRRVSPGLQRVLPNGDVIRLLDQMQAPNDLTIGPDGTIYFTDPRPYPPPPGSQISRVMEMSPDGTLRTILGGLSFCNGIARERDGNLIITEGNGLMRVSLEGETEWIIENVSAKHATDGLAIDVDGRIYMAAGMDHGVRIIEDGREVEFLPLEGAGASTNCCFGGPDNRSLFLTDGLPGRVWVWRDMPTPGLPLFKWPATAGA